VEKRRICWYSNQPSFFLRFAFCHIFKSCQQETARLSYKRCQLQQSSTSTTPFMLWKEKIRSLESNLQELEPSTFLLDTTMNANVSLRAFSILWDKVSNFITFVSSFSMHCCWWLYLIFFYFTDKRYQNLLELVANPVKKGNEPRQVPRVFVELSNEATASKKHLANRLLCEWQANMKMKNPDRETGCPCYQPSSQNMRIRYFLSAMKRHHDWVLGYEDFRGFEGSLGAVVKENTKKELRNMWVQVHIYLIFSQFEFHDVHTYAIFVHLFSLAIE